MMPVRKKQGTATIIYGAGGLGGKGEGLLLVDQNEITSATKLLTHVLTSEFYDRYRDNGNEFDIETLDCLKHIHASFSRLPIGVRASEKYENDPLVPTSGVSSSYMIPNNHKRPEERFTQLLHAIRHIFDKYTRRIRQPNGPNGPGGHKNTLSVLLNPIPGVRSQTRAGAYFYPMSSGVADSFFKHPLTLDGSMQQPTEGFARVAFGHGYAVVRDEFEVIPMATIKNPLPPRLMTRDGQPYFYAINLNQDVIISDEEMSTMSMLHMKFADPQFLKPFRSDKGQVNFEKLLADDLYGYRSGLVAIMEQLHKIDSNFQIEFTWNLINGAGVFHIVQYKRLRSTDLSEVAIPPFDEHAMIATNQFQGHGVVEQIRFAVVINPFSYSDTLYDEVISRLRQLNSELGEQGEQYILVCPGRLGTTNREWGFNVDYQTISNAAVVAEYGYDTKGSPSIAVSAEEMSGGIYGSHFLYQLLGGAQAAEKMRRARMFGSQGTHFLTNLYTSGTLYLFVNPLSNHLSSWFFSFPAEHEGEPIYLKRFEHPVTAYADIFQRQCLITQSQPQRAEVVHDPDPHSRKMLRVINPQKIERAFVFATTSEIREAARKLNNHLPYCEISIITDPTACNVKLFEKTFVLFLDEGAMPFYNRSEFKKKNPFGEVVLLTYDLRLGSAPTREEVGSVCPLSREADLVFYVNKGDCKPAQVMPSILRYVEDNHNIVYHKQARRFIFLVVDDEMRWFSQFLPVLYRIIGQRASVMIARTFEEARAIMDEHGSDVVCLITDMLFPKAGLVTADAGRALVKTTKKERPRIPIIVASKADQGKELQNVALILPKGDPGAVEKLDQYVHDFTGLGDFLFVRKGKPWRRASTLSQLRDVVAEAPIALIEEYAKKDYYSTWLYMHGFRQLADRLVGRHDRGRKLKEILFSALDQEVSVVQQQELVLLNSEKEVTGRARTITELLETLEEIDDDTLKENSANDVFSMWLMRKGYPDLADRIRPIHGEGEELREELIAVFKGWRQEMD